MVVRERKRASGATGGDGMLRPDQLEPFRFAGRELMAKPRYDYDEDYDRDYDWGMA